VHDRNEETLNDRLESFISYLIVVAIGAAILWYAPRLFTLYAFMVTVGLIIHFMGRLWTLIRVSHVVTNAKIMMVARKAGVADTDFDAFVAEMREKDPKNWKAFEQDLTNL
jgi:hypothetical protein